MNSHSCNSVKSQTKKVPSDESRIKRTDVNIFYTSSRRVDGAGFMLESFHIHDVLSTGTSQLPWESISHPTNNLFIPRPFDVVNMLGSLHEVVSPSVTLDTSMQF